MKTILLVEDDDSIREAYAEILTSEGYAVVEATNGRIALEKLEAMHHLPSLVLLDMMMPEMTGAELLDALHESHRLAAMPVVLVSASNVTVREMRGARRFVRKPASFETLMRIVTEFCGTA